MLGYVVADQAFQCEHPPVAPRNLRRCGMTSYDSSFGNNGVVLPISDATSSQFTAALQDADGRIVVTGFRSGPSDQVVLLRVWP